MYVLRQAQHLPIGHLHSEINRNKACVICVWCCDLCFSLGTEKSRRWQPWTHIGSRSESFASKTKPKRALESGRDRIAKCGAERYSSATNNGLRASRIAPRDDDGRSRNSSKHFQGIFPFLHNLRNGTIAEVDCPTIHSLGTTIVETKVKKLSHTCFINVFKHLGFSLVKSYLSTEVLCI